MDSVTNQHRSLPFEFQRTVSVRWKRLKQQLSFCDVTLCLLLCWAFAPPHACSRVSGVTDQVALPPAEHFLVWDGFSFFCQGCRHRRPFRAGPLQRRLGQNGPNMRPGLDHARPALPHYRRLSCLGPERMASLRTQVCWQVTEPALCCYNLACVNAAIATCFDALGLSMES